MKFSTKIFSVYLILYVLVISVVAFTVTTNSYNRLLQQEVNRSISEEQNIYSNVLLYLMNSKENVALASYGASIIDLFSSSGSYLEVFDENLELIATNSPAFWSGKREELAVAADDQISLISRHDEQGKYYLFICIRLEVEGEELILCLVKDINYIEQYRQDQYNFFAQVALIGLFLVSGIVALVGKLLMVPIHTLREAARNIAAGNYTERVKISSKDEIGDLARQFNIMADEVENKLKEMQLESMRQQRFIDNLAHEFRTPLTSIIGYAELLQKMDYDKSLFDKSLGYMYKEGKRMLNLNEMLLDLTFYREGNLQLEKEWVLPICYEAREIMQVRTVERKIDIEIIGKDFSLFLERDMLKSMLINLLDNAIKASQNGGKIIVRTIDEGQKKIIEVQDFGKGMAEEELELIKEPFYRVDKARSRQEGGVGLGVAICNQIAERLNGVLEYESTLGVGTYARVIFTEDK